MLPLTGGYRLRHGIRGLELGRGSVTRPRHQRRPGSVLTKTSHLRHTEGVTNETKVCTGSRNRAHGDDHRMRWRRRHGRQFGIDRRSREHGATRSTDEPTEQPADSAEEPVETSASSTAPSGGDDDTADEAAAAPTGEVRVGEALAWMSWDPFQVISAGYDMAWIRPVYEPLFEVNPDLTLESRC